MQFSTLLVASAAFALAHAKVILTNLNFPEITAGEDFKITWANATGPVSLILLGAQPGATVTDPANLFAVYTIESNLQGVSSYTWSVPANTPKSTYAIEIRDTDTTNYSILWEVIDGVAATTLATGSFTGTATASRTGSNTASVTSTGTDSASATGSSTGTATASSTRTATSTSSSATSTATSAPAGGMASGLTSNLALVFGAAAALFMLN